MYYYCTLLHFLPFSQCCTVQARQQILQPTLTSKMDVARSNDNKYPSDWKATGSGLHTMASSTHMSLRIERPEKKGILFYWVIWAAAKLRVGGFGTVQWSRCSVNRILGVNRSSITSIAQEVNETKSSWSSLWCVVSKLYCNSSSSSLV